MFDALREVIKAVGKLLFGIFFNKRPEVVPEQPPPPSSPPPSSSGTGTKPARTTPWLMRDSTNGFDIPIGTEVVAGYIDGYYAWDKTMWEHHKNSIRLEIAVHATTNDGNILDVETGDATPAQAPDWVNRRRAAGRDPWVYMNESTWPAVRRAFQSRHIREPHYWVAAWSANRTIPPQATALQYANPTLTHAHYDESHIIPSWSPKES